MHKGSVSCTVLLICENQICKMRVACHVSRLKYTAHVEKTPAERRVYWHPFTALLTWTDVDVAGLRQQLDRE